MSTLQRAPAAFRLFYVAFVVSLLGDAFRLLAVNVWIFEATQGSAAQRLVLVLLGNLPGLLLGGVSGVLADRWDAYRVLVASDLLRLGVGLGLVVCAVVSSPGAALVLVAVGNALGVFFTTSAFTVLPRLVDAEHLPRANGLFETSQGVVQVVGASLAALTLVTAGAPTAFLVDAGSFLVSALLLVRLRRRLAGAPVASPARPDADSAGGGWRSFVAAVRLVVHSPRIRVLLLASYGVTFLAACTNFGLIFLLSDTLGQTPAALGLVFALNGAVSVAAAAATTAWLRQPHLGQVLTFAMAGLCVAQVVMGLAPNVWVLGVGVVVSALANPPYNVAVTTLSMTRVPPQYLGRVEGVDTIVDNAVTIAAFGVSLGVVAVAGPRAVFLLSAVVAAPSLVLAAVRLAPGERDKVEA